MQTASQGEELSGIVVLRVGCDMERLAGWQSLRGGDRTEAEVLGYAF